MMMSFPVQLQVDRQQSEPVFRQIYLRFKEAITQRILLPDTRVPSVRALASELGVARGTVENAYAQLVAEGYLQSRGQSGTYVSDQLLRGLASIPAEPSKPRQATQINHAFALETESPQPFQLGLPALDAFPYGLWARIINQQTRAATRASLGHPPATGLLVLREAIASYLQLSRGFHCLPEQVFICPGYQALLDLVISTLLHPGDAVWLEDPGYPVTQQLCREAQLRNEPIPVDGEGINLGAAIDKVPDARAVIVTPAHQSPTGVALSLPRRLALLEWAAEQQSWIIEDDYDSEFRYQGRPLPSLKSLDRQGRVLYAGTFSKVMFPALRIAYLVVPKELVDRFTQRCRLRACTVPPLIQSSVAEFIRQGHFYRHLKRMRHVYPERRAWLVEALESQLGDVLQVEEQAGGIQLLARLDKNYSDRLVVTLAHQQGLAIQALSDWQIDISGGNGLLLGFTNLQSADDAKRQVSRLASIIRFMGRE
ncbi:PLP-dependent aminotransferase family protein [Yersinia nurmii]|uniref:PLP-dependent aminotransferase family protein n=1 Tax=Yersinia nurmii TaxID=685706 RepID=A0AAW7K301_9GAMM|nr:PLP-dependent aminotransferase family protein [Yersinia nurmii]MDN0089179.1 PLP-dependent aminotransferase family protein [Yersinia nurmii]